ncbi:MAG: hypothetical protein AB7P04_07760 [Bacteriovoracia bacterium]
MNAKPSKAERVMTQMMRMSPRALLFMSGIMAAIAGAVLSSACAPKARLAEVKVDKLKPHPLERFAFAPEESIRMSNNKLFLWRQDMSPEHVQTASKIADEIDALDERSLTVQKRVAELETDQAAVEDERKSVKSDLGKLGRSVTKKQTELDTEMAKAPDQQDPDKIKQLETELADLAAQKVAKEARFGELNEELKELDGLRDEADKIAVSGQEKVQKIMEVVDWYKKQPESFVFAREKDGSFSVSISNWGVVDGEDARSFSTADGTILNVKYEELGGVFEFEVAVAEGESYAFKVARSRYGSQADPYGRIFLRGDIRHKRAGQPDRLGKAKLIAGTQS